MAGAGRWNLRGAIAADGHALLVLFTPRLVASEAATSTIVRLAQKSGKVKTSSKMGRAEGLKSADGRPRRNVAPAAGLPHCTISPAFAATRTFSLSAGSQHRPHHRAILRRWRRPAPGRAPHRRRALWRGRH